MKLLVRVPNWLGDAVISRILLANLKEKYSVTVLCKKNLKSLFYDYKTICFDNNMELFKKSLMLRDKYDAALTIPLSFSSAFSIFLTHSKIRAGFNFEARGILLNRKATIPADWKQMHTINTQFKLLELLGIKNHTIPEIYFKPQCKDSGEKYVCFAPFASFGRAKEWPVDRYIELGKKLFEKYGTRIYILGTSKELNRSYVFSAPFFINAVGKTNLTEASCIIKNAMFFVGNDSGLTHLSAAMGTPTAAVFGPTSPVWTGPIGKNVKVFFDPGKCTPCEKRYCPLDKKICMENITSEMVFKFIGTSIQD